MSGITKKSAAGVHHRGYSIEKAIRKTDKFATIGAEVILDWLAPQLCKCAPLTQATSITSVSQPVTGANFRAPLPLHVIMTGRDG